jgi:RNA polymerase sigma-70 factor (ECF subfamily)
VHARKQSDFEGVVLPHLDRAYNLARWLIENDQDAQAIVQAAYRQARQEFGNLSDADPRNWLLTIVWKGVHNWIEQGQKGPIALAQTFPDEPSAAAEDMVDTSEKALPKAANQEWKRLLLEAVSRLPIEFREVLVLHEIEGWNYTQLVSVLEIPRSLVVHRLRMARQSLRQEVREAHRRE